MSVILITNHDENITKITQRTSVLDDIKTVAYKAKMRERMRRGPIEKVGVKKYATMGLPQENPPDPCDFLKKKTGKPSYSQDIHLRHKCDKQRRKLKLQPTKEEVAEYNKQKKEAQDVTKNFIVKNIKTAVKMKAKEPVARVVVEPHGDAKKLLDSLEPIYIKSQTFGKTPAYLQAIIKKREQLHQMQKDAIGVETPKCRYITRDERQQLLGGLKHNWEELQKHYQGLPILTDTIPKIIRKSKLEAELKQLEKDIVLIERHPYIYVYDDNGVSFN